MHQDAIQEPDNANSFYFVNDFIQHNQKVNETHNNEDIGTIDLMDISRCILGISNDDKDKYVESHVQENESNTDEFVSIEAIKRYLEEPTVDYAKSTIQEHSMNHFYNTL